MVITLLVKIFFSKCNLPIHLDFSSNSKDTQKWWGRGEIIALCEQEPSNSIFVDTSLFLNHLAGKQNKSAAGMRAQIGYSWFCNWHGKEVTCDIILSLSLIETFSIKDKNRKISRTHLLVRTKPKHVLSGSFLETFWYELSVRVSGLKISQFLKILGQNTVTCKRVPQKVWQR